MALKKYILKLIGQLFYDKKYLEGKQFKEKGIGWVWLIKGIIFQKILGINRSVPWPVSHTILINNWKNIIFDPEDIHIFNTGGTYFQAQDAKIVIGKNTLIAPNVGLITTNHDINNIKKHVEGKDIVIGSDCWIGMNSIILPGVEIGNNTVVGAGSVVTKSFPEGNNVIVGNPAKIVKKI